VQLQPFFVVVGESIAMAEKNCEKNYGASWWEYFGSRGFRAKVEIHSVISVVE
jgi:hypothetical protein